MNVGSEKYKFKTWLYLTSNFDIAGKNTFSNK